MIKELITLMLSGHLTFIDHHIVRTDKENRKFLGEYNEWYDVAPHSYWESYIKTHKLTANDIKTLKSLGYSDLLSRKKKP